MPRNKSPEPKVEWKVSVPGRLALAVETRLYDIAEGKPTYGSRAKLITGLLQHWLDTATQEDIEDVTSDS